MILPKIIPALQCTLVCCIPVSNSWQVYCSCLCDNAPRTVGYIFQEHSSVLLYNDVKSLCASSDYKSLMAWLSEIIIFIIVLHLCIWFCIYLDSKYFLFIFFFSLFHHFQLLFHQSLFMLDPLIQHLVPLFYQFSCPVKLGFHYELT